MRKKIALVSHSGAFAGAENMCFKLACILKSTDMYYPVVLYPTTTPHTDLLKQCQKAGIETAEYKNDPYIYLPCTPNESTRKMVRHAQHMAEYLYQTGYTLVVVNTMTSLVPALAARLAGIPALLWVHGILDAELIPPPSDIDARMLFDRVLLWLCQRVIYCSEWTRTYYRPLEMHPGMVIPNWTADPDTLEDIHPEGCFVCLNTFDFHKGVSVLLEASKILAQKGRAFCVELFGTGGEYAKLKQYVKENNLSQYVKFQGRALDTDSVYRKCFALIQPSNIESFGLTIIEAMAQARPVIAMQTSGPASIVLDGKTGYLVPRMDAETLAEKMEYLLDHPAEAKKMGLCGREQYERLYSPEAARNSFLQVIKETLVSAKPQGDDLQDELMEELLVRLLEAAPDIPAGCTYETAASIPLLKQRSLTETNLGFVQCGAGQKAYRIHANKENFSHLGICFASFGNVTGTVRVKIFSGRKCLAMGSMNMKSFVRDTWTYIELDRKVETCMNTILKIVFDFDYESSSDLIGLFEDSNKWSIPYRIGRKLKHGYWFCDVLFADFQ